MEIDQNTLTRNILYTADNQLNAKPRLSKDVRMQHFRFHREDAINVNKVYCYEYVDGYLLIQKVSKKSKNAILSANN